MTVFPLIYTRTAHVDFRPLIQPADEVCPEQVVQGFILSARMAMHEDSLTQDIARLRWVVKGASGYVLYGAAARNAHLGCDREYSYPSDRPGRGFFGFVYKAETLAAGEALPFGREPLLWLFEKYVVPEWEAASRRNSPMSTAGLSSNPLPGDRIEPVGNEWAAKLNCDSEVVQIFPAGAPERELVAAALARAGSNVSLVTGLNILAHAKGTGFGNAIVLENQTQQPFTVRRDQLLIQEEKEVPELDRQGSLRENPARARSQKPEKQTRDSSASQSSPLDILDKREEDSGIIAKLKGLIPGMRSTRPPESVFPPRDENLPPRKTQRPPAGLSPKGGGQSIPAFKSKPLDEPALAGEQREPAGETAAPSQSKLMQELDQLRQELGRCKFSEADRMLIHIMIQQIRDQISNSK